jgi:superfamily II DNA or RNA helicase
MKPTAPRPTTSWLSRRGYAVPQADAELVAALKKQLTVAPKLNPNAPGATYGEAPPTFPVYVESASKLYIPRALGLKMFGLPTHDKLGGGGEGEIAGGLKFAGTLRPEQEAPVAAFLAAAADPLKRGGLLVLPCAFGKTSLSLCIAARLGRKTLVVCHKSFLMDQWRERIAQFVPTARVGLIQQKKVDVAGADIVVASLQSLAMRAYPESLFAAFHTVIFDEVHHTSAEVFSRALAKLSAPVMLGLSATPDRKDGLRKVYEWHLGEAVYSIRKRDDTALLVKFVKFYAENPAYSRVKTLWNGKPNTAAMVNQICAFGPRNDRILEEIRKVHEAEPDRRYLIMSDRRGHLLELQKMLDASGMGDTGLYLGGMKQEALAASTTRKFILATTSMTAEAFDVPALNTLVVASPLSSMEQPVGRIQRQKASERTHTPLVIDVWDELGSFNNQGMRRAVFYKKQGYGFVGARGAGSGDDIAEASEKEVTKAVPDFEDDE